MSRAIVDLRKHHPGYKNDPTRHITELKGSKELSDRPDVRLRFFKRITKKANFSIYAIVLDKRVVNQKLPDNYMQRYSILLLNILLSIPVPKNQRWVTMVVDSQAKAQPTKPLKVSYSSKVKRLSQKQLRHQDRIRQQQYTRMITGAFKRFLKQHGTHLHVWHVNSNDDRCIQATDVIGHYIYERLRLDNVREKLYQSLSLEERHPFMLQNNKQWQRNKAQRSTWFEAYEVIKSRMFVRWPKRLFRRRADILVRYAHHYGRTVGDNREV